MKEKLASLKEILSNIKPNPEIEKQATASFMSRVKEEIYRYKARVLSKSYGNLSLWTCDIDYKNGKKILCGGEIVCPVIETENNEKVNSIGLFFKPFGERHDKEGGKNPYHIMIEVPEPMYDSTNTCKKMIMDEYYDAIQEKVLNIKKGFFSRRRSEKLYEKLKNFSITVSKTDKFTLKESRIHLSDKNITAYLKYIYTDKISDGVLSERNTLYRIG